MDFDNMATDSIIVVATALAAQDGMWDIKFASIANSMFDRAMKELMVRAANGDPAANRFIRSSIVHRVKYDD